MKIKDLIATPPKWEHPDPAVRLEAVNQIQIEDSILLRLIADDDDEQVRCAAASKLSSTDDLRSLMLAGPATVAAAARERYGHILATAVHIGPYVEQIASLDDEDMLGKLAISAICLEVRLAALDRVETEDMLGEIAVEANLSAVRQASVQKISGQKALLVVLRDSVGKDKTVHRLAKEKLAGLQAIEDDKQRLLQQCEPIVEALTQHAKSVYNPSFERTWTSLVSRWQLLEENFDSIHETEDRERLDSYKATFAQANRQCEEVVQQLAAEETDRAKDEEAALNVCDRLNRKLADLAGECAGSALDSLDQFRTDLAEEWRKLNTSYIPDRINERYFSNLSKVDSVAVANAKWLAEKEELQQLLTAAASAAASEPATRRELGGMLKKLHWPEFVQPPEQIQTARQELERLEQSHTSHIEKETQSKTELTAKLDQLEQAIESGVLKKADKVFKEAQRSVSSVHATASQQERITKLSVQLRELRDWQGYATNPKREELCTKMEGLITKELHPRDKADRIRALQQEWKSLGASHSYRSQKLWHRFKHAADHAYQPCQLFFKEQEKQRQQDLEERRTICTQLESFLEQTDWDNVNWKGVADIIHAAKKEWRRFENINRSKRKSIQNRFYKVLDQLQAKLLDEQNRNSDLKKALIEQIKLLVDESVALNTAINQTKELQQQWKQVGITQVRADQSLWKEFRSYCDQVFERRSKQAQTDKEQDQASRREAEELCRGLEVAAANKEPGGDAISNGKLNQARRAFDGLDIPQRARASLRDRFKRACTAYEDALKQQKIDERHAVTAELRRRAELCCVLEASSSDSDVDCAKQAWQGDDRRELPPEFEERISQRWDYAQTIVASPPAELDGLRQSNLKEAQLLCVRMELLAGVESPAEAQPFILEYQVSRLNKGLSQREKETRSLHEQKKAMQLDWYCLGPIPVEFVAGLGERFEFAVSKVEGAS
mgnify:CR=1 FL=1|jgi:hypothetical protein|tara:strand:+ start:17464 stop:20328 length:2865 start_codon:yes stop_codon:yes gene_type:complete